ncbi:MAG TPA: ABC transporter ATP-binding protein [Hyphomicrobiales bacterium]|nr:ABC transporter ATP-binding protein [Hyphomicrobiales bacterium]
MPAALLEVRNLTASYGGVEAVKGIGLSVEAGQAVSLIGANGAGKTTTLRALSGLIRSRTGSIRFENLELIDAPAYQIARRGIVQVPEGRQIFAEMTVAENLTIGGYLVRDEAEIASRRDNVLARFPQLKERMHRLAGALSGGEQQMLAIGRALMARPKLLLLDEPSMGLAPLLVEEIFRIIAKLKEDGQSILLVEQNASAALDISDYVYVLENGRIRLAGTPQDVAANPEIVSAYLGG